MRSMTPLAFTILSLASYRITRFITTDAVPFGLLREKIEVRWSQAKYGEMFAEGLTCPFCMGAWVSFALIGALAQVISIPLPALYALAVSSVVGIVGKLVEE